MASIEFITKRIEGAKKNITKFEKKLERIQKAQATNWEVNPYYYNESDLKWTTRDLEEAKKSLAKYEAELEKANEKALSRNVPAITEFLDRWKNHMTNFYRTGIDTYYEERERIGELFHEDYDKACEESKALRERVNGRYEKREGLDWRGRKRMVEVKVEDGDLEPYKQYLQFGKKEEAVARLEKDLTEEYNRKYDFIIERTNEIVKVITDASNLRVGEKGDLNGYIIGTNGTAKVQTIGAGGYNIQCFHFRTLIHKM